MQMSGKLQIRHSLVCGVRMGKTLGVLAVGSAFKLIMLKEIEIHSSKTAGH